MSARNKNAKNSETVPARRQWLTQVTALASAVAVPLWLQDASANIGGAPGNVPAHALVIGNSSYLPSPLSNTANDAQAIAVTLRKLGFNVNLQIDASRLQLQAALEQLSS